MGSSPFSGKTGEICNEIERRLARGVYRYGQELLANELAKEFGASRAPVMVALNYLRAQGYLIITPQVGCKVATPTISQIRDFFLLYGKIEGAMAGLAAQRHGAPEIEILRDIQQRTQQAMPGEGEPVSDRFVDLVGEFHHQIHKMTHSEFEIVRAGREWRVSEFFLFNANQAPVLGPMDLSAADVQRAEIVEAIAARDHVEASRLMEIHMMGKPERVIGKGSGEIR